MSKSRRPQFESSLPWKHQISRSTTLFSLDVSVNHLNYPELNGSEVRGGIQIKLYMEDSKQNINTIYIYFIKQYTSKVKLIPKQSNIFAREKIK
jgi:hypothetical protein